MERQQHILYKVVAIGRLEAATPSPQHTLQQGHDPANEPRVGGAVSALSGAHQGREFLLIGFASGEQLRSQSRLCANQQRAVEIYG
jgi:hypothetical protein